MAKRRRTGSKTFPRRARLWIPFDVTNSLDTAGTVVASVDLLANYFAQTGEEVPIGSTVGPVRWTMNARPTVDTTISSAWKAELLMQLEKEGGRATLPVLGVDIVDAPWYGQVFYTGQLAESSSGVFTAPSVSQKEHTSAMRKITGNGQILRIFGVSNSNVDFEVNHIGHVMLMLP